MQGTPNFNLVLQPLGDYAQKVVFNEMVRQLDSLLLTFAQESNVLVQVNSVECSHPQVVIYRKGSAAIITLCQFGDVMQRLYGTCALA